MQQLRDKDSREDPPALRDNRYSWQGADPVDIDRYTPKAFHDLEVRQLCSRVWQMVCFEQDIPAVGDHVVYENVGRSVIVMRVAADRFNAFDNVCLHRGRLLRVSDGSVDHVPHALLLDNLGSSEVLGVARSRAQARTPRRPGSVSARTPW